MAKPIAVQLYTVRDTLAQDFEGVIRKIAAIGYKGVEPYGWSSPSAQTAGALFKELGLQVLSAHSPMPLGDNRESVLATARAYGIKYLICPYMPREKFTSVEGIVGVCDQLNEANKVARDAGFTFGYHNHDFEYTAFNGTLPYKVMVDHLDPSVIFEIDTYWAQVGGCDPVVVIKELGARVPLLHIKDGPADSREADMTAVGDGKMDVAAIIAAGTYSESQVVELDRCATDMMEAVEKSYAYLVGKGLASGSKN